MRLRSSRATILTPARARLPSSSRQVEAVPAGPFLSRDFALRVAASPAACRLPKGFGARLRPRRVLACAGSSRVPYGHSVYTLPYNGDVLTGVSPEYTTCVCVRVCVGERERKFRPCVGRTWEFGVWALLFNISICEAASRPLRAASCAGLRRVRGRGVEPHSYLLRATTTSHASCRIKSKE